ncbi:hypothetical protein KSP40_PGU002959 [Platanthera guangdongensis]|uniref:Uncharacterized protein n=1 Tax=Platanthera guangdongensis TaxID=2320717 RepID=A0ABR2M2X7_9ASPA
MLPLCLRSAPSFVHFLPRLRTLNPSLSPISFRFLHNQETRSPRTLTFCSLCSPHSVEAPASAPILIEEIIERDWSFLEVDAINSDEERRRKTRRTISAGGVREGSRVLVCMGSEWFVDRLVESAPALELLLVIHESLFALAMMKEKYDWVRCWQGEITALPQRFSRFDAVFVCYFPGMGVSLHQLLSSVASCCSPVTFLSKLTGAKSHAKRSHSLLLSQHMLKVCCISIAVLVMTRH